MPLIRKERAGNDSFGNSWPEDGAVIEVDPEHVPSLLAIDDGGFSEVTPTAEQSQDPDPDDNKDQDPEDPGAGEDPEKKELSEVDPEAPKAEPEAKTQAPAKKAAARKTAASKTVQE